MINFARFKWLMEQIGGTDSQIFPDNNPVSEFTNRISFDRFDAKIIRLTKKSLNPCHSNQRAE